MTAFEFAKKVKDGKVAEIPSATAAIQLADLVLYEAGRKSYDSAIMRVAGNLLSGVYNDPEFHRIAAHGADPKTVAGAVRLARAIVAEVVNGKD